MDRLFLVGQHLPAVNGALSFLVWRVRRADMGPDDQDERGRPRLGITLQCRREHLNRGKQAHGSIRGRVARAKLVPARRCEAAVRERRIQGDSPRGLLIRRGLPPLDTELHEAHLLRCIYQYDEQKICLRH